MMADFEEVHIDVLRPVSISAERSKQGLFADGHYHEFYAVVARKSDRLHLLNSQQLSEHRVGVIEQTSIIPYLQSKTPQAELHAYKEGVIYEALRRNKIDVAVLNKGVFFQYRIRLDLFDLENIFTLYDFPRNYSFYLKTRQTIKRSLRFLIVILPRWITVHLYVFMRTVNHDSLKSI